MFTFSAARLITAPAPLVWHRLADVRAWPAWLPTVTRVETRSSGRLALGSDFKLWQPKLRPATWSVVELEMGLRFAWESMSPGLRMWARHTVQPVGPDGSRVRLEFRFHGWLAPLAAPLVAGLTRRYLWTEVDALKAMAEADARQLASAAPTRLAGAGLPAATGPGCRCLRSPPGPGRAGVTPITGCARLRCRHGTMQAVTNDV